MVLVSMDVFGISERNNTTVLCLCREQRNLNSPIPRHAAKERQTKIVEEDEVIEASSWIPGSEPAAMPVNRNTGHY